MRRQRRWLPLLALILCTKLQSGAALPVPEDELDTSTRLLGSSVVTSVSVITSEGGDVRHSDSRKSSSSYELPHSPAGFFTPDRFQFYTYNDRGDMITRQMTEQEIQSLIAAGGGHLPMDEPQKADDMLTGGKKVADVVQKVQNVLKSAMDRPTTVMSSMPTIPGHANDEWSSILPAILAGEAPPEPASIPESRPETSTTVSEKVPSDSKIPASSTAEKPEVSEKPMIPVPVITIDKKPTTQRPLMEDSPMFQILNIIPAENASKHQEESSKTTVNPPTSTVPAEMPQEIPSKMPEDVGEQTSGSMEPLDLVQLQIISEDSVSDENREKYSTTMASDVQTDSSTSVTMSVISETHSTSMKIPGLPEMPLQQFHATGMAGMKPEVSGSPAKIPESIPIASGQQIEVAEKDENESTSTRKTTETSGSDVQVEMKDQMVTEMVNLKSPSSTEIPSVPIQSNPTTEQNILTTTGSSKVAQTADQQQESTASIVSATQTPENKPQNAEPIPESIESVNESLEGPSISSIANDEPIFEPLPEIKPESGSSETSAIEQIIETLNQKVQEEPTLTTIKADTIADEGKLSTDEQTESQTTLMESSSTVAAPVKVENQPEMPSKPMENLSSELANSLSSMINQISDVMPSILPVSPSGPPEGSMTKADDYVENKMTTLKPTTLKAIDEPIAQTIKDSPESSEIEEPTNKVNLPLDVEAQKLPEATTKSVAEQPETSTVSEVKTEMLGEDSKSKIESTTMESEKEIPETALPDSPAEVAESLENKNESPETTEQAEPSSDSPITGSNEVKSTPGDLKVEITTTSGNVIDNVKSESKPVAADDLSSVDSNVISTTENTNSVTLKISDSASTEEKNDDLSWAILENVSSIEMNDEENKEATDTKVQSAEEFVKVNSLTESPPVKIQQSNHASIVNEMLQTAEIPTSTPSVEAISLPADMDNVNANNLASSLIAGFQSTTQNPDTKIAATTVSELSSTVNTKLDDSVGIPVEKESAETEVNSSDVANQQEDKVEGLEISSTTVPAVKNAEENPTEAGKLEITTQTPVAEVTTESVQAEEMPINVTSVEQSSEDINPSSTVPPQEKSPNSQEIISTELPSPTIQTILSTVDKETEGTTVRSTVSDLNKVTENTSESIKMSSEDEPTEVPLIITTPEEEIKSEEMVPPQNVDEKQTSSEEMLKDEGMVNENSSVNDDKKVTLKDEIDAKKENVSISEPNVESGSSLSVETATSENSTETDEIIPAKESDIKTETEKTVAEETTEKEVLSVEDQASAETKKPVKPEVPVVRIDISPETIQQQLPAKIQLTDLPIVQKISFGNPSSTTEKSEVPSESVSENSSTEKGGLLDTSMNFNNSDEIVGSMTGESPVKLEAPLTRVELLARPETGAENSEKDVGNSQPSTLKSPTTLVEIVQPPRPTSISTETVKPLEEATTVSNSNKQVIAEDTQQKVQEIRIQVNDTAVLVTKHPLPELIPAKSDEKKPNESVEVPLVKLEDGKVDVKKDVEAEAEKFTTPALIKIEAETIDPLENPPATEKVEIVTIESSNKNEDNSVKIAEQVDKDPTYVKIPPLEGSVINEQSNDKISATETKTEEKKVPETVVKVENMKDQLSAVEKPLENKVNNEELLKNLTANVEEALQNLRTTTLSPNQEDITKQTVKPLIESTTLAATTVTKATTIAEELPSPQQMQQSLPEKARPEQKLPVIALKKPNAESPTEQKWALIPQQIPTLASLPKKPATKPPKRPSESTSTTTLRYPEEPQQKPVDLVASQTASGLDASVRDTSNDIINFSRLCNELAFSFWMATNKGLSTARSLALSPFGMTSLLAMIFLGARGPTSEQMNEILRLDDVATFNPHLVFQNVTDAVSLARNQGIANAAFVRELFADKSKVRKLMPFYKDQAQQFYEGLVAEVNFAAISDLVRRRTNLLIRKQTGGRIKDFVKTNTVPLRSPLAAMSANVFQTDCNSSTASSEGRDGELYFAVSPAVRQRKLVPVPATVWRSGVLAGYEPSLDATAVALGGTEKLVSTIFVIPGQQGQSAPGDTLDRLEQRLVRGAFQEDSWNKLLKVLIPRPGLELQVPKFSHRSVVNATAALKRMGLDELFSKQADLKGINGVANHLHLADVLQMNLFSTCGDENIQSGRHHVEIYPSSSLRNARHFETDEVSVEELEELEEKLEEQANEEPEALEEENFEREKREASQERPRLKLDRPFLYFVRHNPTGLILHMGRFNPRLLP